MKVETFVRMLSFMHAKSPETHFDCEFDDIMKDSLYDSLTVVLKVVRRFLTQTM